MCVNGGLRHVIHNSDTDARSHACFHNVDEAVHVEDRVPVDVNEGDQGVEAGRGGS